MRKKWWKDEKWRRSCPHKTRIISFCSVMESKNRLERGVEGQRVKSGRLGGSEVINQQHASIPGKLNPSVHL